MPGSRCARCPAYGTRFILGLCTDCAEKALTRACLLSVALDGLIASASLSEELQGQAQAIRVQRHEFEASVPEEALRVARG